MRLSHEKKPEHDALSQRFPEPMTLMERRRKELDRVFGPDNKPWPKPKVDWAKTEEAAQLTADWDRTDPFAYGRVKLHMRQGYVNVDQQAREMKARLLAQKIANERAAARKEPAPAFDPTTDVEDVVGEVGNLENFDV